MNLRLTIRRKLYLATFLILLVSYAILIRTTVTSITASLDDHLVQELSENLLYAKDQYFARGEQIRFSLLQPATAQPVIERIERRDLPWLSETARRWRANLPYAELLLFIDKSMTVIGGEAREKRPFELTSIVQRAFRDKRPVVATELVTPGFLCSGGLRDYCGPASRTAGDQVMMLTVVVPVIGSEGRIVGAIVAGDVVDNDVMIPSRVREVFGKRVMVAITRGGAQLPGSPDPKELFPSNITPDILGRLQRGIPFRGDAVIGGKEYKTAFEPIANSRGEFVGSLYVALSRDDYMGILRESLRNIMASAVVGVVLTFFTALLVARKLTMPLNQLSDGVRKIEGGDLRQRVDVASSDEVGDLADAFNRMARSLEERDRTIRTKAVEQQELNRRLREMNEQLERRVAERTGALRTEMGRLEAILTGMAEGIAVTDRDGRVILFNPAAQRLFEMVPHRVVGRPMEQVCAAGGFCALVDYVRIMRDTGDMTSRRDVELEVKGKSLKVNLSPLIDEVGGFAGVVMSVRDVTAEEEVDRMKTEFISTVSHELKTPLTSIKGSLQFILDRSKGFTETEGELLNICLRNTDRLIRLVNEILDIGRIESGRMEFVPAPQDLPQLIAHSVEELQGFAREHDVTVECRCAADIPRVYGDRDRLVQVITNLLSNAVKFSPRGERVVVTAERNDNYVAVSVADRGREIQWMDRSKLFKKFQQLDNADRRQQGGTGLGLAICKEIVERHHGRIFYSEGIEGGNVFTFTVPVCEEQP
ncbi:MAG: HAMP domain-containing protein [Desulfuromonadales bacterium]|nr:MAG: HAMP domain-containing protein [Desulfuromonadales bacterium]